MKSIGCKRKRPVSCEKSTEMKCPLSAESLVSGCTEQRVTKAVDEPDLNSSPRKKCVSVSMKSLPSPGVTSVTFHSDSVKGKENKEFYTPGTLKRIVPDETVRGDGLYDDSGYLSLHNSHIEYSDVDFREHFSPSSVESTPDINGLSTSTLPILSFQQKVCRKLSETFKKSQSYDWSVINALANNSGLQNVIGGKMGLECVDILSTLFEKDMKHILTTILHQLGDSDLISCKKVSKTWGEIICQEKSALKRCTEAEQRIWLESRPTGSFSRDFARSRVVLSSMQRITSTPVSTPSKKVVLRKNVTPGQAASKKTSQFQKFQEAARTLKQHEGLRACRQCNSPARYDSAMKRAVCTRASCAYDFCTLCLASFHGSSSCRTGVLGSTPSSRSSSPAAAHLPCSKQSRRNIRRL
ncbi:F-box only protein 5 [Clupea harengus]|uniref:F-box only protein 5 n=1 Tax=Clupea harengus TaxID=7950 RepID=A0A8M1KLQ4_CLUHA|nr:F-box only protein 5 [Clupea harengus]